MAYALDYIDVAQRIADFRVKHPEGSLQPANKDQPYKIEEIGGQTYIVVVAAAYRSPDDERPGIGMAYEIFPGKTNFTRGSELQNAETSAWGRAIVASMAGDTKKGIASAEEVRNRKEEQTVAPPRVREPAPAVRGSKVQVKSSMPTVEDIERVAVLCERMDAAATLHDLDVVAKDIATMSPKPSDSDLKILQDTWKERRLKISLS